jgi:hypothetical protein
MELRYSKIPSKKEVFQIVFEIGWIMDLSTRRYSAAGVFGFVSRIFS